jgi:replicative DNA helicase
MTDRELLFNDAESCLLGAVFQDPAAIYKIYSELSPQDFSSGKHGIVFAAMRELADENMPIDILTVMDRVARNGCNYVGRDELFNIMESTVSSAHIEHYAGIVRDLSIRRRLSSLGGKITAMVKDGEKTEDIAASVFAELNSLGKKGS